MFKGEKMIRKVIAVSLFAVMTLCIFISCKNAKTEGASSVLASSETNGEGTALSSKVETSSVKSETSSKKENASKKENSSKKEVSSQKEENSTLEKESSSKKRGNLFNNLKLGC